MGLSFQDLIKFDLVNQIEEKLGDKDNLTNSMSFLNTYQAIQAADQFIRDCPSFPGSTDKIIRSEMISAIGSTLAIEGGNLEPEEIEKSFEKAQRQEALDRCEQEAENSRKVYEFIVGVSRDQKNEFAYTESLTRQMHTFFTDNLNYLGNTPGQYRTDFSTSFGEPRRRGLCRTTLEINEAMRNFTVWLNRNEQGLLSGNPIIKAIMTHYYLTEIHPFGDGNGRTARAMEALILYVNRINQYCFWSLANFWNTNRAMYINYLGQIRDTGNPWELIMWGTKGYLREVERIKERVLTKLKRLMFTDYIKWLLETKKTQKIKINDRILKVLQFLTKNGPMPLSKFSSSVEVNMLYSKVKPVTRSRDFQKIASLDLIQTFERNGEALVEVNFQKLEKMEYAV